MTKKANIQGTVKIKTNNGVREFKGELASPFEYLAPLSIYSLAYRKPTEVQDSIWKEAFRLDSVQHTQKMIQLLETYEINYRSEEAWYVLATKMAEDFVPAFKGTAKRGRPVTVFLHDKLDFLTEINRLREGGLSVAAACSHLSKKAGKWKAKSARGLEQRYRECKAEYEKSTTETLEDVDTNWQKLVKFAQSFPDLED